MVLFVILCVKFHHCWHLEQYWRRILTIRQLSTVRLTEFCHVLCVTVIHVLSDVSRTFFSECSGINTWTWYTVQEQGISQSPRNCKCAESDSCRKETTISCFVARQRRWSSAESARLLAWKHGKGSSFDSGNNAVTAASPR